MVGGFDRLRVARRRIPERLGTSRGPESIWMKRGAAGSPAHAAHRQRKCLCGLRQAAPWAGAEEPSQGEGASTHQAPTTHAGASQSIILATLSIASRREGDLRSASR
eukprot:CAMPEP_0181216694 /NCGR_PEP_ID=MMETSP1096-20121128/26735_1 /TAXON_ID=156174 ORGANISM="Chrysochromulina ericina, Strain CCMP281" /NCGR_SAMPLE_ID=MMETSP1096 /ASSEMBLY_ACC=CAM_ASM_000453 /LENGTH=106 /DNA_ID=CAMNT_0023308737 /DNA_START=91 /DNA_END=409 /DNA_ORIENTATION=-